MSAYTSLIGISRPSQLTITIPSNRGFKHAGKSEGNPLEDIPDAIESWTQTAREYFRMWDTDKIEDVTNKIKESLDDGGNQEVLIDVTMHVDWGGDRVVDSILADGTETIGDKSSYIRSYEFEVRVKTDDPSRVFSELNKTKDIINNHSNIDPKAGMEREHRESTMREINERMRGDASFDRGYKEQRDRAEGREGTMWA
ncbi:MAG: hypothetical protein SGI89_11455 [bacterium]|nr:hypothetical protein [bacterium]